MTEEYNKIKTVQDLYDFLDSNIKYGYLGKSGRVYHYGDEDFDNSWKEEYILEDKNDLLRTGYGNCWDQVELERAWFKERNYELKTIFEMVSLDYDNDYPTHTFLVYKDGDYWYWFEHADYDNRGIHKYDSLDELLDDQYSRYLKLLKAYDITDEEINNIIFTEYDEPNKHLTSEEYLDYVTNCKRILRK